MAREAQERIRAIVGVIEGQREKLHRLHEDYYCAYDAAFDEHSARTSLEQWCDRTNKLLRSEISEEVAKGFRAALLSAPRGRGSWAWGELTGYLDTYLVRLAEDIVSYPDDPTFTPGRKTSIPDQESGAEKRYDVFLSYSSLDKDEAREIAAKVGRIGKRYFMAEKSLEPGDNFQEEIRDALEHSTECWILVSPNSVKSAWVQRETAAAWALRKRIVPILLRCAATGLPDILADRHAVDFHKVDEYLGRLK